MGARSDRRQHREDKRRRLIDNQDRRCPVCDDEINHGAPLFELTPGGLVAHQGCWSIYRRALKRKGFVMDRVMELVNKGYIGNTPPSEEKV